ncbi:hypothetical protein OEA41_008902 [Lepraria neglecta]|uniref:Uncharacterized protein n=1 Tax=Lepraria neglecta TaxID=209136 RepID=A0AAD9Z2R2_9LECA|nr:hypothetical protein OEA41_008902 [Lepraria neglecta]
MTSNPAASRATASSTANVRRNLFHHQLSRRPTSSSTSTTATPLQESLHDDSSDIVVKDRNGEYDIQVPLLPPLDEEQAQEEEVASEKEKLDARLLEMYKDRSLQPGEPAELLTAVQASLRRKVASLDDDNWMFEAEQQTHGS